MLRIEGYWSINIFRFGDIYYSSGQSKTIVWNNQIFKLFELRPVKVQIRGWKPDPFLGVEPEGWTRFLSWVELGWTPAVEKRVETGWVEPTDPKNGLKRVEFIGFKFRVELSFYLLQLIEPEWKFNQNIIKQLRHNLAKFKIIPLWKKY